MPDDRPALRAFSLREQNTQPLKERQTVRQHHRQKSGHQRPASGPWYIVHIHVKTNTQYYTLHGVLS